jgi:glycine C-acetyltransferase
MMTRAFLSDIAARLAEIDAAGLTRTELPILSAQRARIEARGPDGPRRLLNLCANNYLGLADHPGLIAAARAAMETHGYGLASVRFICGTQDLHLELEAALAAFLGKEDAILFAACFDANGGLFEPLLGPRDAIVSDALNHASIIDGIRLCKARRYRYRNADMDDLETRLKQARADGARHVMVATDGVFSMDGFLAPLPDLTRLARAHDALVMVDDCHATGLLGPGGAGTPAHFGVAGDVDILTGTLGKALGGALGGYVAGPGPVIALLRQRARPYLFSNALPPAVLGASLAALKLVQGAEGDRRRQRLRRNAARWRDGLSGLGFDLLPGEHPIVPVMLGEARRAQAMARALLARGVHAPGFFFPVVPEGRARIRTQMSAALDDDDIAAGLAAFEHAGRTLR